MAIITKEISTEVEVYVDIEDYLDEVDDDALIKELEKRGIRCEDESVYEEIPEFDSIEHKIKFLYSLMGIKPYHGKERLFSEINELLL